MTRLIPGAPVVWNDKTWILLDIPALDRVLLRDPENGHLELTAASDVRPEMVAGHPNIGLMAVPDKEWNEAWRRFEAIRPLLGRSPRKRNQDEIDAVAKELQKDRATIYRWISKWEKHKTVSGLVRSGRADVGKSRLSDAVEAVIKHEIDTFYLALERPSIVELWGRIAIACRNSELPTPNLSTVRRRVDRLQDRLIITKRFGAKQARETFEPIKGSFPGADVPLAVYQIDHTPIDMIFVDEAQRRPIGRAFLTIVKDTRTRMLAGFSVSLDPPGALATGLAMVHAILPKTLWMAARSIDASWPIRGIPTKIFADNAAEFRGTMLERACHEYGILMENRPKGLPNYGGHVERLFRTFMKRVQRLPGSTFSNVQSRGEYDSDGRAIMTLAEFEQWFGIFVTKVYHHRPHRGLQRVPPIKCYEQLVLGTDTVKGIGLPEPVRNEFKLRLDFMPYFERTIQEYGVVIDNIHYYADILRPWIHARDGNNSKLKRKFVFARDPRDLSEIYFLDPETKTYFPVPYRDITRPRISIWELNAAIKRLSERPELQVDEDTIFEGLAEMAQLEKDAAVKSRKIRRDVQRRDGWRKTSTRAQNETKPVEVDAPWEFDVQPFDDIDDIDEST